MTVTRSGKANLVRSKAREKKNQQPVMEKPQPKEEKKEEQIKQITIPKMLTIKESCRCDEDPAVGNRQEAVPPGQDSDGKSGD